MKRIVITLLLSVFLVSCAGVQSGTKKNPSFKYFWGEFRSAVIDGDKEKVASLTKFPFEVRGSNDFDPFIPYDRTLFLKIYDYLISQKIYILSGSDMITKTMLDVIKEKKKATKEDLLNEDFARVEQFTFILENGQWFFNRAYMDDPDLIKKL